ncbi:DUF917 domain-containing protein [Glaciecola petra]|uniref:DUF917 domain-containing protein n=1 Tax=Glaciecola petra TaxID=3075602 RepID=A0ABU2ZUM9_9ALTE|nr:DUF917 domain-containing protein [Aestuariibacter sp. P117]MDT0596341.1 DUF917 domain-containing protein [Aestuariibacter sp. P117]
MTYDTTGIIQASDLNELSLGSVFLATGGGGDPYVPKLLAEKVLEEYGSARLVKVTELADDAHVVTIGSVGAPTVSLELLPSVAEIRDALEAYEKHTNKKIDALVSFEIGGGNSLIPIIAAAIYNIPVVDGDGMGRALPEAQMMTYAIAGAKPTPAVSADYEGNITTYSAQTTATYERHIRAMSMASGGMITAVEHPMTGKFLKSAIIPGTLSFAIAIGKTLNAIRGIATLAQAPLSNLFERSEYGACQLLYCGKVSDKATRIIGGYDIGEATISSFEENQNPLRIKIKNEYLLASTADENGIETLVAMVPDLIVIVDYETTVPINAERLKYGQRVAVFAVECPTFFTTERALEAVSPRCFGFDTDYIRLSQLNKR